MTNNLDVVHNPHTNKHMQNYCLTMIVVVLNIDNASRTLVTITIVIVMLELVSALKLLVTITMVLVKDNNYLNPKLVTLKGNSKTQGLSFILLCIIIIFLINSTLILATCCHVLTVSW